MSVAFPRIVMDYPSYEDRMAFIRKQEELDRQQAEKYKDTSTPVDHDRLTTSSHSGGCVGYYPSPIDEEVGTGRHSIFHEDW